MICCYTLHSLLHLYCTLIIRMIVSNGKINVDDNFSIWIFFGYKCDWKKKRKKSGNIFLYALSTIDPGSILSPDATSDSYANHSEQKGKKDAIKMGFYAILRPVHSLNRLCLFMSFRWHARICVTRRKLTNESKIHNTIKIASFYSTHNNRKTNRLLSRLLAILSRVIGPAHRIDILVDENDLLNHCKLLFRTRKHRFIYKTRMKKIAKNEKLIVSPVNVHIHIWVMNCVLEFESPTRLPSQRRRKMQFYRHLSDAICIIALI